MTATTIDTIKELLDAEIELATCSIGMYYEDGEAGKPDLDHWVERLAKAVNARHDFNLYSIQL